jgi:CO/xanthine dehydrogenase Mo-binding subunit
MNDFATKALTQREFKVVGTRPLRPDGVDKVTGRAKFGADLYMANMLVGKVLRSPHAHARIKSIDTSKALALQGVKAVITAGDLSDLPSEFIPAGEMMVNYRDMTRNVMARETALYEGHAVAAVAATTEAVAVQALDLIEVDYEVLPHVIDVAEAMAPGAPVLHDNMYTIGVDPKPAQPSNVAKRVEFNLGDIVAGFAKADVVVEREFTTAPVHQSYIEPHACVASVSEDGQAELWCTTQGQFIVRSFCAKLLGMDLAKLRVTPSEIGGGFGGKTVVYLEPLALALSRKSGQPVKMVMSRTEVFQSTGPTSGSKVWVKVGATRGGRITAADALLKYQAGAFQGSPVQPGAMCAFAPYELENVHVVGFDVVSNRPKVAAYRAPGAPISEYAVESVIDELAKRLEIDPIEFRLKNAAKEGTKTAYGQPRPRRRVGILVQHRRRDLCHAQPQRGRRRDAGRWHPGYRRVACLARHDGGRRARYRARQGASLDRRHEHPGLHLSHRWQSRHVLQRHGGHRRGPRHGAPVARTGGDDLGDRA